MEMEIGKEGFGVCNDTFDKPLKPTGLATSTINQERHHIPPLLEAVQETMESYKELQEENSKLKQLLEQQLAEVERVHVVILEENEVLSKENLELRGKVEEQRKLLEKNEMERNLLEGKLNAIKKRFLKMNWAFAGLAKEIEGGGSSLRRNEKDMEVATAMATQKMGDLPNCVLPDLPVSSWTSNLFSSEKAEIHQDDTGSVPASGTSKCSEEAIMPSCSAAEVNQKLPQESSDDHHETMTIASLSFAAPTPNRIPVKKQNKKLVRHAVDTNRQDEGHFCVCGHSSSRNYDLIRHVSKFNARNGFRFNCPVDKREQGFSSISNDTTPSCSQHGIEDCEDPSRNEAASTPKPSKKLKHALDGNRQQEGLYCACGRRFSLKHNLTRHINYFNSKGQGKFVCSIKGCGKRFYANSKLKVHMKNRHKLEYNKTNGCTKCGETFSTLTLLLAHYKTMHQSVVTNAKDSTGKDPAKEAVLKKVKGVVIHGKDLSKMDASEPSCFCLCGQKFSSKERLSCHVYYHSGGFNFKCDVCGKRFRVTSALRDHMKRQHKMKYFGNGCKACGRVFPDMSALLEHRKSHVIGGTGDKDKTAITAITPSLPVLTPHDLSNQIPASVSKNVNVTLTHGELEENLDSNSFPCLCGSQFEDKSGLMDHIRLMMVFAKM